MSWGSWRCAHKHALSGVTIAISTHFPDSRCVVVMARVRCARSKIITRGHGHRKSSVVGGKCCCYDFLVVLSEFDNDCQTHQCKWAQMKRVYVCVVLLHSIQLRARGVKNLSSTRLNYKQNLSCGTPIMGRRKKFEQKKCKRSSGQL